MRKTPWFLFLTLSLIAIASLEAQDGRQGIYLTGDPTSALRSALAQTPSLTLGLEYQLSRKWACIGRVTAEGWPGTEGGYLQTLTTAGVKRSLGRSWLRPFAAATVQCGLASLTGAQGAVLVGIGAGLEGGLSVIPNRGTWFASVYLGNGVSTGLRLEGNETSLWGRDSWYTGLRVGIRIKTFPEAERQAEHTPAPRGLGSKLR